ncbi:hypothetical protein IFR05_005804 [Cadophora sp. M221]|nr:hypothetical protein IFR05_005804 [Cadophora sp. M221]
MSLPGHHSRKIVNREDIIIDPDGVSDRDLHRLSQRELSKRLPFVTSTRATFSIYLRWLEVHRTEPSTRTEHWSNTLMHWAQSLAARKFSVEEVVDEVERWKSDNGPFNAKPYRSPPTEGEIRKAFEGDPKAHSERKTEKMGDSYRPESRREKERERRMESRDEERESRRERRVEESSWRDRKIEDSWRESPKDKRHVEKAKFDGPPPPNYICNRCGEKGHHLQVCPTNLDPSYDQPPDENYICEICHKRGDHFKSLCPKNADPYSIIQKRKARGIIATPPKAGDSQRDEWEKKDRAQRDREIDRHERRSWGRLTEYSSSSSARGTQSSSKKLELLESLQDLEDRKRRLFREQSDDIGDMIRESTVKGSSDRKRDRPDHDATSIDSPAANTIQARKKAKMAESEHMSPDSHISETKEREGTSHTQDSYVEDMEQDDTEMTGYEDSDIVEAENHQQSAPPATFTLRPIGMSPGSMISDGSSDEMETDELISRPIIKEYSHFVKKLMLQRPEMSEVVNVVKRRKTAREMWKEADQLQKNQSTMSRPSESPVEYGRLTPIVHDEVMAMNFDGACDGLDYNQEQDQEMTSPEFNLTKLPSHFTTTNSQFQTSHQTPNNKMATPTESKPDTKPETPTTSTARAVHFPQREEMDVDSAFKGFPAQQRRNVESVRLARARNDPATALQALKAFSTNFKLSTPIPSDLVDILSNNPEKQKEMQAKTTKDAEEVRGFDYTSGSGFAAGKTSSSAESK